MEKINKIGKHLDKLTERQYTNKIRNERDIAADTD